MRLLLLTTALTGLTLAPALAQESDDTRRGVSPQEYFGDREDGQEAEREERDDARAQGDDQDGDGTVTVTITGVDPEAGEIYVALQDETGFAQKGGAYTQIASPDGRSVRVTFEGVASGEYAVAAFQDTDGDGDLTLERTGPTEPWGVSGGTPRRAAPTFDDAMISVEGETRARLRLIGGESAQRAERRQDEPARRAGVMEGEEDVSNDPMNADGTVRRATRRADPGRQATSPAAQGVDDMSETDGASTAGMTAADRVMQAEQGRQGAGGDDADVPAAGDSTLTVTITGVEPDGGDVYVALQEEDGFARKDGAYTQTARPDGRSATVTFDGVEPGEYAVAAFQDTDGDGDLTLERTGPTERWGFSGRVSRNEAPQFDDASINVDGTTRTRVRLSGGAARDEDPRAASRDRATGERRAPVMGDAATGDDADDTSMTDMDMSDDAMTSADRDDAAVNDGVTDDPMASMTADAERDTSSMTLGGTDRSARTLTERASRAGGSALVYRRSAALAPDALTARDYLGAELTNSDGEDIAAVEDVILDERGQAVGVIIATGGLFGIGQDLYAVTFDRVNPVREGDEVRLVSTLSERDVDRLREFDLDEFRANIGERRLASDLAGASVRIGGERGRVEDVVMNADGAVEAVVLDYDGAQYIVAYGDLTASEDGFALSGTASDPASMTRFEARRAERRTVRERVLGERR